MTDEIGRECDLFARYLTGETPTGYVRERYAAAHGVGPEVGADPVDELDARLLEYGRRGGARLRMADVYARFFRPGALLRRKLVLVLALLETAPPTQRPLNTPRRGGTLRLLAGVTLRVLRAVGLLLAGVGVFAGAHRRSAGRRTPDGGAS